jgi:hypothetical protein
VDTKLSVDQVAEILNLAGTPQHRHRTVRELWHRGELKGTKLNYRTVVFEPSVVQKFIDDRATQRRKPRRRRPVDPVKELEKAKVQRMETGV